MASQDCNGNDSDGSFTEEQILELTSNEEDVQLKQMCREKREKYRELINEIQVTKESGNNSKGTLKKMNQLFDGVTRIREMAYDSHAVDLFAQRELLNIENMQTNLVQFNELEFCTKLRDYMGAGNRNNVVDDEDSYELEVADEAWVNLGYTVSSFFKKSPSFHFMLGSFETGEVQVKKRQVKERELRDKKTPHTKPIEVKNMDKKDRDKTTEEVENIYETLNHVYEASGNKPVSYFGFCIDPKSFSITVENMFYVAFLVKDGCASLSLGTNKLPEITPLNKNDENAVPAPKGVNQLVQSFTVKDYKREEEYIMRSIVMRFKCETEACTLSQWLFQNLRNSTFTILPTKALDHYLHEKDVPALETMDGPSKLIAAVEYGVLDFALQKVYPQPLQTLTCDVSPLISISSVCILSSMSPKAEDSEVMSLVVLDTFVFSFTIGSLLFVSIIAFAFSSILHKKKANVTSLLKHIWIFTADILQNQDLSVLGRNLYMLFFSGAWILASMVIVKGYSGSLKCDMIVSKKQPINTVEDVIARKNVAPIILENFYFAVTKSGEYTKLKSRADKLNSYYRTSEIDEIKEKFSDGKAVIFASRQYPKPILKKFFSTFDMRKVLKIYVGDRDYEARSLHYYMYKGLNKDVRENVVYLIARYVETRQSMRFKFGQDRLYNMVLFRGSFSINLTKTLTARFLLPAFFLYLSGILISIIVIVIEAIFYFKSNV